MDPTQFQELMGQVGGIRRDLSLVSGLLMTLCVFSGLIFGLLVGLNLPAKR